MKKLFVFILSLSFVNVIFSIDINESNFLEFLSSKEFISAKFIQTTNNNYQERKITGELKANRKGMFKVVYGEPLNEIISSNGHQLFRLDKEIEQLDISSVDSTVSESPIGIFSSNPKELENIFLVTECSSEGNLLQCLLEPKLANSFLKFLSIELINDELNSLTYIDTFDQTVSLYFLNLSWKTILDEEFLLDIPEGIDVINH